MPETGKYLNSLFLNSLTKFGANIALQNCAGKKITYSQLKYNCLENNFFKNKLKGSEHGLIAIYSEKNPETVELMLSVLLSGNSYLPLDFYSPPERIIHILRDSDVKALVLENKTSKLLLETLLDLNLDFITEKYNENYSVLIFRNFRIYTPDTAYILYTSGSTGVPKGVIHTQVSAFSFVNWCNCTFNFKEGTNFISIAPFSFDISVLDIYSALSCGGTLFIPTNNETSNSRLMAKYIGDFKINVLYSTPTFFRTLKNYGKIEAANFESVNYVLYAGEALQSNLVLDMMKHFTNAKQFNLYGPTETNVCCYHPIDLNKILPNTFIPIGKACNDAQFYLPKNGEHYELFIASKSLMKGYVGIKNNFLERNGDLFYDSGDLVVKNSEGLLIFKGRKDKMVKRHGYRIEIAEIDNCIAGFKEIKEHSIAVTDKEASVKIVVFFVADGKISELQLKEYCLKKIPSYMIPDFFIQVEKLNINTNFKTDLNKLLKENDFRYIS